MAAFRNPAGVAFDALGNVLVADSGNHVIRRVTPNGSTTHISLVATFGYFLSLLGVRLLCVSVVTTVAGSIGSWGFVDGATPLQTQFNSPFGVSLDASGSIIVSDRNNNCIRLITPAGGTRHCWLCARRLHAL